VRQLVGVSRGEAIASIGKGNAAGCGTLQYLSAFILEQAARERQKQAQKQSPPSDEKQT